MGFIGKEPQTGAYNMLDNLTASATASYSLTLDSTAFVPESANHLLVSLNGVIQKAGSSYTVSGSTLTFSSALTSSDSIDFVLALGNVLDIGTPSDATVTNAKTNFVSTSSAAGLQIKGDGTTDGTLQLNCSQNSHGIKLKSPAHSTSSSYTLTFPGTDPSADKFLKTDGSGNLSFADAPSGTHVKLFTDTSPSGGAVNIGSSYITSTYKAYLLRVQNLSSDTDNWRLLMRHSTDNNSSSINSVTDSYYQSANSSHGSSTYSNNAVENNLNVYLSHDDIGNGANEGLNGFAYLFIDTTKPKHGTFKFTHTNSNRVYMYQGAYYVDTNSTVNGINLRTSAGDFDGGLIELYGIV